MARHRGTEWKLACPRCGTTSDEVELEWDQKPDFSIRGEVDLTCEDCGHAGNVEAWEWTESEDG